MNATETKKTVTFSPEALAKLGGGAVAYIREIEGKDAIKLLGGQAKVAPKARLYALYHADGSPVSISGTRDAAVSSAFEHELLPMSVH